MIKIDKNGQPWQTLYDCTTDMIFDEKGIYDATCYLSDGGEQGCSTRIQVDIMTIIPTGPFVPTILVTA